MKVYTLFQSEEKAGNFVEAINEDKELKDIELEFVDSLDVERNNEGIVGLGPSMSGSRSPDAVATPSTAEENPVATLGLSGEEQKVIEDGLREGASVVVLALDQEQVSRARTLVEEHNGRFFLTE